MDITNKKVQHSRFGDGIIVEVINAHIKIKFQDKIRTFIFPDSFLSAYLTTEDEELNIFVNNKSAEKSSKKEDVKKLQDIITIQKLKNKHTIKNNMNIAFKCNYCNGGLNDEQVGFSGICSDILLEWNTKHYVWCSNEKCLCKRYINGEISRKDLEEKNDVNSKKPVCYESRMLIDWKASAGVFRSGNRKGNPMRLRRAEKNSLCFLTTKGPSQEEKDRYIFGVFLIDKKFEGDSTNTGYVSTTSNYKIKLSPIEAKKILFWKYYKNPNKPEKIFWGTGLHRYIENRIAAIILKDIMDIKIGTKDELLSKEFFMLYCKLNNFNPENIGVLKGAIGY